MIILQNYKGCPILLFMIECIHSKSKSRLNTGGSTDKILVFQILAEKEQKKEKRENSSWINFINNNYYINSMI